MNCLIRTITTFLLCSGSLFGQELDYRRDTTGVLVMEGQKPILHYQVKPVSANGKYRRANYIHPLYGLDGEILTEDFPDDHPHHRGIFWAWHQVLADTLALGDSWECLDFNWDVYKVDVAPADTVLTIASDVLWKSPRLLAMDGQELPVMHEKTEIRIYPRSGQTRMIDFKISLLALVNNLWLGGSEDEKVYGGFSVRMKLPDGIRFYSEKGRIIPQDKAVRAGTWMNITGAIGTNSQIGGLLIFDGSRAGGESADWILREKGSMQNAVFPGRTPVGISMETPTVLRYRLVEYNGSLSREQIASFQPPW